jgi:hypothetical protein
MLNNPLCKIKYLIKYLTNKNVDILNALTIEAIYPKSIKI